MCVCVMYVCVIKTCTSTLDPGSMKLSAEGEGRKRMLLRSAQVSGFQLFRAREGERGRG